MRSVHSPVERRFPFLASMLYASWRWITPMFSASAHALRLVRALRRPPVPRLRVASLMLDVGNSVSSVGSGPVRWGAGFVVCCGCVLLVCLCIGGSGAFVGGASSAGAHLLVGRFAGGSGVFVGRLTALGMRLPLGAGSVGVCAVGGVRVGVPVVRE